MLDRTQKILLQLLKEIDDLCQSNGVHYSLGGGTTIGAIRHKGFIPWDDDIDLYMTRENWVKFIKVYEDGKFPSNRVLQSCEFDGEYSNTFGRYVATDNAAVHANQIARDDPAGYVIDIFVFDPIMKKDMNSFLETYMLECDLINETMGYSTRFDMNISRYEKYLKRKRREGLVPVVKELTEHLTALGDNGHDSYAMEWGSAPMLMNASIFDQGYIRLPFENIEVESVRAYSEYLTYQYGDEWVYIPSHDGIEGHEAIFSDRIHYDVIRDDFRSCINMKQLNKALISRKIKLLKSNPLRHKIEDYEAGMKAVRAKLELTKLIEDNKIDVDELYMSKDFLELAEVFNGYYSVQFLPEIIGRLDRHSKQYRYFNPVAVILDENLMAVAVETLMRTERMSKAARLLEVYRHCGVSTDKMMELCEEIDLTRSLINIYSMMPSSDVGKLIAQADEFLTKYPENSQIQRLRIRLAIENIKADNREDTRRIINGILDNLDRVFPAGTKVHGELHKYRGDVAYLIEGDVGKAKSYYEYAYGHTTNGIIRSEIESIADILGLNLDESDAPWEELISAAKYEPQVSDVEVEQAASAAGMSRNRYLAMKIRRKLSSARIKKDDMTKQKAIDVFRRTGDRVKLYEYYEDKIDSIVKLREEGRFDELADIMKPHAEAVEKNYKLGLGLMVHPVLSEIQYELFRREGKGDMAAQIDKMVPAQHRKPIGE